MRQEAENWLKQAESDLRTARICFDNQAFDTTAFLCHQSAEKSLKTLVIERAKTMPEKTRGLLALAKILEKNGVSTKEVLEDVKELNPHYSTSRYPDASNGVPSELYTQKIAANCLHNALKIMFFVKKSLGL